MCILGTASCFGNRTAPLLGENEWYGTFSVWTESDTCYVVTPAPGALDLDCIDFDARNTFTLAVDPEGRCWEILGAYSCDLPEGWSQPRSGFCSYEEYVERGEFLYCCDVQT